MNGHRLGKVDSIAEMPGCSREHSKDANTKPEPSKTLMCIPLIRQGGQNVACSENVILAVFVWTWKGDA